MIVLDTNVVSELLRTAPAPQVEAWIAGQDGIGLYFTAVGEAELRRGIAILPAGRRRSALAAAVEGFLEADFQERILPFDSGAATAYATIAAERRGQLGPQSTSLWQQPSFSRCGARARRICARSSVFRGT